MEKELTKLGLSGNEAKVYLAILSLGISDAAAIARQAKVKRPTTYLALEHLIQKGLVSEAADSKEKRFKAEGPDKLNKLTRKMRRQVIEAEAQLEKLLPGLKAIQKKLIEAPKVSFYQGLEGIKTILEEASASVNPWYLFGASEEIIKTLSPAEIKELMEQTDALRKKAGRPMMYMITDKGIRNIKPFDKDSPLVHQIKFLPMAIKPRSVLIIYDDKLAVINISDVFFGAIIDNQEVAELVKFMFKMIWGAIPEK